MDTSKNGVERLKDGKDKAIGLAMAQIERQFGKGAIMRLGAEAAAYAVPVISTGAISLDVALGVGGVPRGRVTEIFGPEASGKTTIALHLIAEVQRAGGIAAFIDAEHALDPVYAQKLGVKTGDLVDVSSARGKLTVKAVVTPRMKPLKANGTEVTIVWMPYNWGFKGLSTGASVNHLTIDAVDPGAGTQETKACLVNVVKSTGGAKS